MSRSSETWRSSQRSASRAVYITVHNCTNKPLYRTNYALYHGIWSFFPPEKIPPQTTVDFGSQSSGPIAGTEGFVCFAFDPTSQDPNAGFQFQWINPFIGTKRSSYKAPEGYVVKESAYYGHYTELTWVCDTAEGGSNSNESDKSKTVAPIITYNDNLVWKQFLQNGIRSIHIIIDNQTECLLRRRDQEIVSGYWALLPPEHIQPFSKVEFGAYSHLLWIACTGSIFFNVLLPSAVETQKRGNNATLLRGDFYIKWQIPIVGYRSTECWIPPPLKIESTCVGTARLTLTIFITQPNAQVMENSGVIAPLRLSIAPATKHFKVITLNTNLLPPVIAQNDPLGRARGIATQLKESNYDIVCLQEVLHPPARKLLVQLLKPDYPYIVQKVGANHPVQAAADKILNISKDSGLFVASKFPIMRHEFSMFPNRIGPDAILQKGVLGVKLDLSSIIPDKVLLVFCTHMQSNPDSSIAWKLVPNAPSKAQAVRKTQVEAIYNLITEWVHHEGTLRRSSKDASVIVLGDFNIAGETISIGEKDSKQKVLTESIPKLASSLNNKTIQLTTTTHLIDLLGQFNIPLSFCGFLRQTLLSPRDKLIVLLLMISEAVRQMVVDEMRSFSALSGETDQLRTQFMAVVCKHYSFLLANPETHTSAKERNAYETYWNVLLSKVKLSFDQAFPDSETNLLNSISGLSLLRYQVTLALERTLKVSLRPDAKLALMEGVDLNVTLDNLEIPNWDDNELLFNKYKDQTPIEAFSKQVSAESTPEYLDMLDTFNHPRDLFRETNRTLTGFTVDSAYNVMVKSNDQKRVDYILCFDEVQSGNDTKELHRLLCSNCKVVQFGDSPTTQLSDHFGLECTLSL